VKLSPRFTVVMLVTFVLPAAAMGLYGRASMLRTEAGATVLATQLARDSERTRLLDLARLEAAAIDTRLALVAREVAALQSAFQRAEPAPISARQRERSALYADRDAAGLPAYAFVDPEHGVYADHLARSDQGLWIPRPPVARARTDSAFRQRLAALLHRLTGIGPLLADIGGRVGDDLDLVWIVTTDGPATVWPPYDVPNIIADNPAVLDLDESTMDYVQIVGPERDPDRALRWTPPYLDRFKGVWLASAVAPLYDGDRFEGAAGADLLLASITQRVSRLSLHTTGYALLLGARGEVLAAAPDAIADLSWNPDWQAALLEMAQPPRLQTWTEARERAANETTLNDAPEPGWQTVAKAAFEEAGALDVAIGGETRAVFHAPIPTAGWAIVVVAPESAVTARGDAVATVIAGGANDVKWQFSLFASAVLLLTVASSALMRSFTVAPLVSLARRVGALTFDRLALEADDQPQPDEFRELEHKIRELLQMLVATRDRERAERGRLLATLGSIRDAVVVTDDAGIVQSVNPAAELVDVTGGRAVGMPFEQAFPLTDAEGNPRRGVIAVLTETGAPALAHERLVIALETGPRSIEVHGASLRAAGEASGAVVVLRDVTDRRRMEDELVRVQRLAGVQTLAEGIAHDFNNVLSGVLGYVSLARDSLPTGLPASAYLRRAEEAIDRARALTSRLLTFSVSGDPVCAPTAIVPVLEAACAAVERAGYRRPRVTAGDDLWNAECDATQITQAAQNLLDNACRAAAVTEGKVSVRIENDPEPPPGLLRGRAVRVTIADEGPGIPANVRSRVSDAFFTTRPGAPGLGLAVCESILRKHHGALRIESTEGLGTSVQFWLPATEEPATGSSAETPPARPPRVLILDDDGDVREVTAAMVRSAGFEPECFATGEDAVAGWLAAREAGTPFDLVLLDITLPDGMGGVETLAAMREHDPEVLGIVCSGYGREGALADPSRYGFAGRIRKPFGLQELSGELHRVLATRNGDPAPTG
jgi:PAS domain S-box-containing protein